MPPLVLFFLREESGFIDLPPKSQKVSVERDIIHHPVSERNFANVDEFAAANWVLDRHVFEFFVEESAKNSQSASARDREKNTRLHLAEDYIIVQ